MKGSCNLSAIRIPTPPETLERCTTVVHNTLQFLKYHEATLSDDPVPPLPRRWTARRTVDRISTSLWLICALRWLQLDSSLLTAEVSLLCLVVAVVGLVRRWRIHRRRSVWRWIIGASVVRLSSSVLCRCMASRRTTCSPSGTPVWRHTTATTSTSSDASEATSKLRTTKGLGIYNIREYEEEKEPSGYNGSHNDPTTITVPRAIAVAI